MYDSFTFFRVIFRKWLQKIPSHAVNNEKRKQVIQSGERLQ